MGAWGTAIFSDDVACDIRDDYKELIGEGLSNEDATNQLIENYSGTINDYDEGSIFWLALAATQWKCGRLLDSVKDKAIEKIDDHTDLRRWEEDKKLYLKREKVLNNLRLQLNGPMPAPKKIPKRFKATCEFQIGDAISYRLLSGNYIILKLVRMFTDKGGTHPYFEVCDWVGLQIPTVKEINELRLAQQEPSLGIGMTSAREYPRDRISLVAKNTDIKSNCRGLFTLWRYLDNHLDKKYGFK